MHELTDTQQRVVVSLIRERDGVVAMANTQVVEINAAIKAAGDAFSSQAGLEGEWEITQEVPGGPIGLTCLAPAAQDLAVPAPADAVGEELPATEPETPL